MNYIYGTEKGRTNKIGNDKMKVFKTSDFTLFVLLGSPSFSLNSHRAINFCLEFIREKCKDYYINERFEMAQMVCDMHDKIIEMNLKFPHTSIALACVFENQKKNPLVLSIGDSYAGAISGSDIKIPEKKVKSKVEIKYLGGEDLVREEIVARLIKSNKDRVVLMSYGLYWIIKEKRKDFLRILNYKSFHDTKIAIDRVLKNRNNQKNKMFDNLSYIYIEK